ncbi:MAG: hypothetical protein HY908_29945, partial [Myxococcales bacterium]|nr:hypothetical protein [Myxococcales bacterium]
MRPLPLPLPHLALALAASALGGCEAQPGTGPASGSGAAHGAVGPDARELCRAVFAPLGQKLDAACSAADRAERAHGHLRELALEAEARCVAAFEPVRRSGQGELRPEAMRACGAALAEASWKDVLDARDLSLVFPASRELVRGRLRAGDPCASSLHCADGLVCAGEATGRTCRAPATLGAPCVRGRPLFGGDAHPLCEAGLGCASPTTDPDLDHPLGVAPGALSPEELARLAPARQVRDATGALVGASVGLDAPPPAAEPPASVLGASPTASSGPAPPARCAPEPPVAAEGQACGRLGCLPGLYCDAAGSDGSVCRRRRAPGSACVASPECQGR